ncbi:MAG TPA: hypothetical protein ENL27_02010 [Candidatus Parcubacteria bacterium]|nr:hypothetical protein [Candidatus Parcubacteria bacterium]
MKNKNKEFLKNIIILGLSLLISGGIIMAWTGPSEEPPGGNVAAPINVGRTTQEKEGGIRFLKQESREGEDDVYTFNVDDIDGTTNNGMFTNNGTFINNGGVGIYNGVFGWYMNNAKIHFTTKMSNGAAFGSPALYFSSKTDSTDFKKAAYIMVGSNYHGAPIGERLVISTTGLHSTNGVVINSANSEGSILFTLGNIWRSGGYQKVLEIDKYGLLLGVAETKECNSDNAGRVRWTGNDFEGCVNNNWVSLTQGGTGGAGYWEKASDSNNIYYNNGNVGIGTDNPTTRLEVDNGPIKATGGLIIQTIDGDDPTNLQDGQIWLRTDVNPSS